MMVWILNIEYIATILPNIVTFFLRKLKLNYPYHPFFQLFRSFIHNFPFIAVVGFSTNNTCEDRNYEYSKKSKRGR